MGVPTTTDKRQCANPAAALIFDFGNVVAFFDYDRAFERLGTHLGISARDIRSHWLTADSPIISSNSRAAGSSRKRLPKD